VFLGDASPKSGMPNNSAVQTAELQADDEIRQLQLTNLPDFPVVAFLSISFTHHTAILSQVKSYEERKFYIQFAADYKMSQRAWHRVMWHCVMRSTKAPSQIATVLSFLSPPPHFY